MFGSLHKNHRRRPLLGITQKLIMGVSMVFGIRHYIYIYTGRACRTTIIVEHLLPSQGSLQLPSTKYSILSTSRPPLKVRNRY